MDIFLAFVASRGLPQALFSCPVMSELSLWTHSISLSSGTGSRGRARGINLQKGLCSRRRLSHRWPQTRGHTQSPPALVQLPEQQSSGRVGRVLHFHLSPVVLETRTKKPTAWDPHTSRFKLPGATQGACPLPVLFRRHQGIVRGETQPFGSSRSLGGNTAFLALQLWKSTLSRCEGVLEVVAADVTFPELWQDLNLHLPSLLYVQNFLVLHPIWSFPTSALAQPHSSSDQGTMGRQPSPDGSCRDRYGHPEVESCSPRRVTRGLELTGSSVMPLQDRWPLAGVALDALGGSGVWRRRNGDWSGWGAWGRRGSKRGHRVSDWTLTG